MQVEADIKVDDAIGWELVVEHPGLGKARQLARDDLVFPRQVRQRERRDRGERLRPIRLLLHALELPGRLDDSLEIKRRHAAARRLEPRTFFLRLAFRLVTIGLQQQPAAMAVVDEVVLEQPLEIMISTRDLGLESRERTVEGESRYRIESVEPRSQGAQHERDSAWKCAGVAL